MVRAVEHGTIAMYVLFLYTMFGIHVSKSSKIGDGAAHKTILAAIQDAHAKLRINAVAIYTHGPRRTTASAMPYATIAEYCAANGIYLCVHSSYLSVGVWRNPASKLEHIADQIIATRALGGAGLVLHLPKASVGVIVDGMREIAERMSTIDDAPMLILEMPASRPDESTYETPTKLAALVSALDAADLPIRWGMCIDTAHQWSCGVPLTTKNHWDSWIDQCGEAVRRRIALIHLNGAELANFGRGKDVHMIATSAADAIWHTDRSGLEALCAWAKKGGVPLICEINVGEYRDSLALLDRLRSLLGS